MRMKNTNSLDDAGKLVLRLLLAALLLFHGISKIVGGPGFIVDVVTKAGLPGILAYFVYVGEVLAPLLLLCGVLSRAAALVIAINMLVAIALVHAQEIFTMTKTGGWALELQAFYLGTALAIALLGAGRYSIGGLNGRWN